MTVAIHVLVVLACLTCAHSARTGRFLWPFSGPGLGLFDGPNCGGPGDCPPHHCRLDPAVIQGYCCGCGRLTDRVPIQCPPGLRCPLFKQSLCFDYDYMMDCCC